MKQMYPSIVLAALACALPQEAHGWANNKNNQTTEQESQKPADNRNGLFEIDYLFWKPYQEDLNVGARLTKSTSADGSTLLLKENPKSPSFSLSSGVRLGIGGYTSDKWDVKAKGTYLYSDAHKTVNAEGIFEQDSLFPAFYPLQEGGNGTKIESYWRLNYGTLDLTVGRDTALSPKFSIHPFIGIRSAWLRQMLKGQFVGILNREENGSSVITPFNPTYKHTNNVWGIGPRVGLDSHYYFAQEWSFVGGLSGAFVLGNYRVLQRVYTNENGGKSRISTKDNQDVIRANLEGYLGLSWDKWFNQNKNRVCIALLCETSYWFGINQYLDVDLATIANTINNVEISNTQLSTTKRHGDLAFFGGTVHFQVDF